jgi:hypothetical protein
MMIHRHARQLFRAAQILSVVPFIEFLANRTGWSAIPIMLFYTYLIVGFRCRNCRANLVDPRVSRKVRNSLDFLEKCPNCGQGMADA